MDDSWEKKHRKPHKIFEFCRKNYRKFLQIGARGLSNVSCSKFSITMAIETIEKKISNVEKWKVHQKILARGVIAYNASQSFDTFIWILFHEGKGVTNFYPTFSWENSIFSLLVSSPKNNTGKGGFHARAPPHLPTSQKSSNKF